MENMESKDSLKNSISKVLNSNVQEKNKSCPNCKDSSSIGGGKCKSCNQVKTKLSPLILMSLSFFSFMVYGIYKAILELYLFFTQ